MTPGDGGCLPGTVILSSPAVVGRHAVIYKLGRDGRICAVSSVLARTRTGRLTTLKPALLPRWPLPLHRPLPPPPPPPCPHPSTARDPLLPQYPVLSNHFRRFPLRSC